jgi:REP element-mobilizing transposase RayT
MPDHIHLLITLSSQADLSNAVRLFKGRMTPTLRKTQAAWQPSFYDHRLGDDENVLPVFLYIFLNPYRDQLCAIDAKWPGYYCTEEDWTWFGEITKQDCPEPAWLR